MASIKAGDMADGADRRRVSGRAMPAERASQILDAAVEVFARKGYQRATTKEIAAVAGVAEGTIYNYFRSKRELLIAIVSRLAETVPPLFTRQVSDERERIAAIIRNRFEALERSRPFLQAILHELAVDEELRQEFFQQVILPVMGQAVAFFQQRAAAGDFRPVNPRVALPAMIGAVGMTALATEMAGQFNLPVLGPPLEREQVIGQLVELILHGVAGAAKAEGE